MDEMKSQLMELEETELLPNYSRLQADSVMRVAQV